MGTALVVPKGQHAWFDVGHGHLRWLNPFPRNLKKLIAQYERVLIPELNTGQLRSVIRQRYLIDAIGLNKIQGKPFVVGEIVEAIKEISKS